MLRIAMDEFSPRFSVDSPRKSGPLSLIIDGISRKSFSYYKLPDEPLKLSVRKLDGSCFDIEVMKTATIAELKKAVEAVFSHLPKKGPGKISWPHVWGHFCLCFENQKLLTDTDHIKYFGIKDGDQLYFTRHLSSSCNMVKVKSKKDESTSKQQNTN
ncbi:U11/U12 small nuclear ribonucleoprotein 25 kDa protein-like isoform X2 [Mangifera indica]|uniref:U11/U12 small nuclear ribonucleoprotein 25 kDa protein-like isoform X2 n=1 Tax=Mangifera indica TaxID=29780 RepID=UPI001CFBE5E8|nr:U11/U12 small nuclear ribonucleoprotein 25 kDa protein-like isoform X2 [Mangifera indica]